MIASYCCLAYDIDLKSLLSEINATTSSASSRRKPSLQPPAPLSFGESAAIIASPISAMPPDMPTLAMHSNAPAMSGSSPTM
jgi:hypothetical protein